MWNAEFQSVALYCSYVIYLCMQSCDVQPGTVLALTIIPVHDDNIDLEYEPVSYIYRDLMYRLMCNMCI